MTYETIACLIWGDNHRAEVVYVDQTRMFRVKDSARAVADMQWLADQSGG